MARGLCYGWSYPYQIPEVVSPPLSLDSTLGELIDHPQAYARVMSIITEHYPGFMERVEGQTEMTVQQALDHHPRTKKLGPEIEAALASLGP